MRATRGEGVLACLALFMVALVIPPGAGANAPPKCDGGTSALQVPAGGTVVLPTAACSDVDGDPIEIEIDTPASGALDPPGRAPIEVRRYYTAHVDAEGETIVITFRAHAGGRVSNDVSIEYSIGPLNHAPECDDVAVSVQTGTAVKVPFTHCTDADGDPFQVAIEQEPAHGVFDYLTQRYLPATGFSGGDLMTFRAMDRWRAPSALGRIRITVTAATQPSAQPTPGGSQPRQPGFQPPRDVTAPSLELRAPNRLPVRRALRRGLGIKATTDEVGHIAVRAFVTRGAARRLKIAKQANGRVAVASLERLVARGTTALPVRLSRRTRRWLKPGTRVNLRIIATITDSAGNARTRARRIKLR